VPLSVDEKNPGEREEGLSMFLTFHESKRGEKEGGK